VRPVLAGWTQSSPGVPAAIFAFVGCVAGLSVRFRTMGVHSRRARNLRWKVGQDTVTCPRNKSASGQSVEVVLQDGPSKFLLSFTGFTNSLDDSHTDFP
jgi:hypothetical protein